MDIVYIRDLRIQTVIGIYEWERKVKQIVSIDLDMGFDISKAAASDDIDDALNYKAVAQRVVEFVEDNSFQLVEALAEKICAIILQEFHVGWVKLRLGKPGAVVGSKEVGLIIERGQQS